MASARTKHLKVLGLDEKADEATIKKAFKKLALLYHPDRNSNNVEEATERFKEIQNAYAVLSDPHERSWYDAHRDSILRGGSGVSRGGAAHPNPHPGSRAAPSAASRMVRVAGRSRQ